MSEKFLCLIATFDDETSKEMKKIEHIINEAGMLGKQTLDIPHHITLAYFDISREEEIKQLLHDVCGNTKSFDVVFNHIGLFGLKVMFLAPDVSYQLLDLQKSFDRDCINNENGWTAHTTILIDEAENIQKALPLVSQNFERLSGRIVAVSLYEFFPTRFIAECKLQ
jgi:2'-5' RNA ligase